MPSGTYRNITGNLALSYGLIAGSVQLGAADLPGLLPDHPGLRHPPRAEQAQVVRRDDVPGRGRDRRHRRGAGRVVRRLRSASRPPPAPASRSKSETIGLAVMTELPLLVIDVQRGGPSTGLPTKTEQADLLQAMFGRNGESPVPIVAPAVTGRLLRRRHRGRPDRGDLPHPGDAALRRLSSPTAPSRGGSRRRRAAGDRPAVRDRSATTSTTDKAGKDDDAEFWPYLRDEATLARPWAIPGTAGLEHRIGGLEKGDGHGNISYDPANHDFMVRTRQAKVDRIADSLPPLEVDDPTQAQAKVLVLGWGSTYGPIGAGVRRVRKAGYHVAQAHLRHLNPFPERPRRDPRALRQGAGARDEPRPALACCCAQVPRRRDRLQPRPRAAAEGGRARRGDRRAGRPGRGHRGRPRHPRHGDAHARPTGGHFE